MRRNVLLLAFMLMGASQLPAQQTDSSEIARLKRQLDVLSREVEALRLGEDIAPVADSGRHGLAPAAAKVYSVQRGVSLGGYGEFLYENFSRADESGAASGKQDVLDALRAVLYVGYRFNDRFLFNSEIEFEHASTEDGGEVALEFGFLEFRATENLGVRAGLLLMPIGFLNELHEPPTYLGAKRPLVERQLIPSTWRENGLGVFGDAGPISYRAYLVTALDGADGFSAEGFRDGRSAGAKAPAENFAGVARLDYQGVEGLTVGGSGYLGHSGQGATTPAGDPIAARTTMVEGHLQYRRYGIDLRGLAALGTLGDAAAINARQGLSGNESVGSRLTGWYVQGGYDVLRHAAGEISLVPYLRYEQLNTQQRVPAGFVADPANDREVISFGAMLRPIPEISVKGEYQLHANAARSGVDQLNIALGYLF